MLKEKIQKAIDDRFGKDFFGLQLRGELEIIGKENGKITHYDKSNNVVTVWSKHIMMHLLTGEIFSTHGNFTMNPNDLGNVPVYNKRLTGDYATDKPNHGEGLNTFAGEYYNVDGTILSGEAYFDDNANYTRWSAPDSSLTPNASFGDTINAGDSTDFKYPFYPTKMLFGTGIEYAEWADIVSDGLDSEYGSAEYGAWDETSFNNLLTSTPMLENYYSDNYDSLNSEIIPMRTVNDVTSGVLSGSDPTENDYGIAGAIKNGHYWTTNSSDDANVSSKVGTDISGNEVNLASYRGIGRPAYIYATRAARFMDSSSEILLEEGTISGTEDLESKITISVTMPDQPTGLYYPYNGYTLKLAGLFTDAKMLLSNDLPDGTAADDTDNEFDNYMAMPGGVLLAKRKIYPIYKSHTVEVTAKWTLYL